MYNKTDVSTIVNSLPTGVEVKIFIIYRSMIVNDTIVNVVLRQLTQRSKLEFVKNRTLIKIRNVNLFDSIQISVIRCNLVSKVTVVRDI